MTDPWCNISRPIPHCERQRVYVRDIGYGMTQHKITLGGNLVGIEVALDRGGYMTVSPREIVDPPAHRSADVVPFPRRLRLVEAGS